MKTLRGAFLIPLLSTLTFTAGAPPQEDPQINRLLGQIDQSSERGNFSVVQNLRMQLAEYAVERRRFDIAARQYELLLAARPAKKERVRLYTRLGKMRMVLGDYSRAIASFDDALHDNPKDWDANIERARAFFATDLNQRAIESYLHCIRLRPQESAPYEELGRVYERQGFLGKALGYYQQALAREPKPDTYLHMADCYVHLKDLPKAVDVLAQAKARLPRAEYDVRLGDIYQSLGDMARAGVAWEEALKSDPQRDDVRLKLAFIYDRLHRRADTDRMFSHLLATYPRSPLVHHMKAVVLWERGEISASRDEALQVERLSPTEQVSHYNELLLQQIRKIS